MLDDVTVGQPSTVMALHRNNPDKRNAMAANQGSADAARDSLDSILTEGADSPASACCSSLRHSAG